MKTKTNLLRREIGLAALAAWLTGTTLLADPLDAWHFSGPQPTSNTLQSVTYGARKFVAVGDAGTIVTSVDGAAWSLSASGTSRSLRGVAFGGGMFVAVGEVGTVLVSSDGLDWTARDSRTTNDLYAATFGQDLFVVVGAHGTIATSPDGVIWDPRQPGILAESTLTSIAYGQGTFLGGTTGSRRGVFGSNNGGADWWVDDWLSGTAQIPPALLGLSGAAYGTGRFVVVGAKNSFDFPTGVALSSTNAFDWKRVSTGEWDVDSFAGLWAVAFGRDTFVSVGPICLGWCSKPPILSSIDGSFWRYHPSPASRNLFGVAYGRRTFVVVGESGTILQSDPIGPRLELVSKSSLGSFDFSVVLEADESCRIEASGDLTNWTVLTNFISTSGTNLITDPSAPNFNRRFYRAVSP